MDQSLVFGLVKEGLATTKNAATPMNSWLHICSQTSELSKEVLHVPVSQGAAELQIIKV